MAVPAQEELAGGAVPVAVEDVVQAVLFHSRVHALLALLFRPVAFLLFLRVEGRLHRLLCSGQKAQEKEEREKRGAKYRTDHGQRRSAGRAERWITRGVQYIGRRLQDFSDPAPFACFGADAKVFRDYALFAPACHVKDLLADADPDRSTESISCAESGRWSERTVVLVLVESCRVCVQVRKEWKHGGSYKGGPCRH
ncbi:hypothetical protein GCM10010478_13270 [Streptomyces erythrogriseus]|uniref:Transposase n=1 Tax=Streptomyces erythrogriseus TaxID=284027 RepID=A0ABN3WIE6_9ACTN